MTCPGELDSKHLCGFLPGALDSPHSLKTSKSWSIGGTTFSMILNFITNLVKML